MKKAIGAFIIFAVVYSCWTNTVGFCAAHNKIPEQEEIEIQSENLKFNSEAELYNYAQNKLDKNTYRTYRVAERIIRANNLAVYPWVIEFLNSDEYEINASSSNMNLISLKTGTILTMSDDVSMLASVIAHEMAHQTLKHSAVRMKEMQLMIDQLDESIEKAEEKLKSCRNETNGSIFFGLKNINATKCEDIERDIYKLEEQSKQIEDDMLSLSRKQEYEADKTALTYMIKAGFDPQGIIKKMNLFEREISGNQDDSTHPSPKNRVWQINTELKSLDKAKLKTEGLKNIKNSKPLTFEMKGHYQYKYLIRKTLVIHSNTGTNNGTNEPFEKLFGY
jgi:hypothetical protein